MRMVKYPFVPLFAGMLITCLSFSPLSQAEADEQQSPHEGASPPALGIGIPDNKHSVITGLDVSTSGKLFFSFVLILGGYGLIAKYRGKRVHGANPSELHITSKIMLTPRTALLLVKVHGRSVLCAVGPEQVSIMPTDTPMSVPFQDLLGNEETVEAQVEEKKETDSPAERSIS